MLSKRSQLYLLHATDSSHPIGEFLAGHVLPNSISLIPTEQCKVARTEGENLFQYVKVSIAFRIRYNVCILHLSILKNTK